MKSQVLSNLDNAASIIGTLEGIADAAESDEFIRMVCMRAHDKALSTFDQIAALSASRRRNLRNNFNHMYEYGVPGITAGAPVITDPTSPAARLWVYNNIPERNGVSTVVSFREAKIPNPKPSERPELRGMPKDVVAKMSNKDYFFKKRAEVTESGQYVQIRPRDAKALIFPAKESMNRQGYQFWTSRQFPLVTQPGRYHKGSFERFFYTWWNQNGQTIIDQHVHQSVAGKIGAIRKKMKSTGAVKPTVANSIPAAFEKGKKQGKQEMMRDTE